MMRSTSTPATRRPRLSPRSRHVPFSPSCSLKRPAMSSDIQSAFRGAKKDAARQGCLFAGVNHLVLGLLSTDCYATTLLTAHGIHYGAARETNDAKVLLPVNPQLTPADVDFSPAARDIVVFSQECAQEQGSSIAGTHHLAVVLLASEGTLLREMAEGAGLNIRKLEDELLEKWESQPEEPAAVSPAPRQVALLKEEYVRMVQLKEKGGPTAFSSSRGQGLAALPPSQKELDDIYE